MLNKLSRHELTWNEEKTSNFNIFLKNHPKISCLLPVLISLQKPKKKFKKVSVFYLVPVLFVEKGPKKILQNEFSTKTLFHLWTRYRVLNKGELITDLCSRLWLCSNFHRLHGILWKIRSGRQRVVWPFIRR